MHDTLATYPPLPSAAIPWDTSLGNPSFFLHYPPLPSTTLHYPPHPPHPYPQQPSHPYPPHPPHRPPLLSFGSGGSSTCRPTMAVPSTCGFRRGRSRSSPAISLQMTRCGVTSSRGATGTPHRVKRPRAIVTYRYILLRRVKRPRARSRSWESYLPLLTVATPSLTVAYTVTDCCLHRY